MAALNPFEVINMARQGDPKLVAQQLIQQNFPNDPAMQNLLEMGNRGDIEGVNKFAQQYFAQRGLDFNNELQSFLSLIKGIN